MKYCIYIERTFGTYSDISLALFLSARLNSVVDIFPREQNPSAMLMAAALVFGAERWKRGASWSKMACLSSI